MRLARYLTPLLLAGALVLVSQPAAQAAQPARPQSADLAVTGVGPETVLAGADLTVSFTVTNFGTATSYSDRLVADLGADYVSSTSDGFCQLSYGELLCNLGQLAKNEKKTVQIRMRTARVGTSTTTATVRSDETPDPNAANDSVSVSTAVADHPRVETVTAPAVVTTRPCTMCGFFPYETVTVSFEVAARDGSLPSEGYVSGAGCSAAVVEGHAACTYNTTHSPATGLHAAFYNGTFNYAPSASSSTP